MSSVSLDSGQLAAARRAVTALASAIESQRHAVTSGTPVSLAPLADGGPARWAAVWLEQQVAGLRSLEDLARLLETTGGTASYDGSGSFEEASRRLGPEIARVLGSLDPEDQQDLVALAGIAGLLQRYSGDPQVENALIEEVAGTGLLDAFTSLVPVGPEPDATPEEVHQWWLSLTPAQQLAATLVQSRTYGNTDGLPAQVRDLANRKNLPEYREELLGLLDDPAGYDPEADPGFLESFLHNGDDLWIQEKLRALDELETVLARGDRQLLMLDPFDGQQLHAAVAIGDVDTADHVSVFTPGFTSNVQDSLGSYDADMYDLQVKAAQQSRMYGDSGTVATVTWLGYDAPQMNEVTDWPRSVAMPNLAEAGGDDLAGFYEGINSSRAVDPHLTALGHSYGSLTTGYALQHDGTGIDDAVLFGSPGTGTWHRGDLHVPDGHLFVAEADGDPVADLGGAAPFGADPSHLDGVDFLSTHERDLPDGGHGSGSSGHSEYLEKDTTAQYNLAVTVAGLPENRLVTEGAPPLFRDGRPTGDFYSSVPDAVHHGYETGRAAVEVTGEIVGDSLEHAWDTAKDFRLHNPVVHVPW